MSIIMENFQTLNPYTEKKLKNYHPFSKEEIQSCIDRSNEAFINWRRLTLPERIKLISNVSKILQQNKEDHGTLITLEMGKLYAESIAEIEKCIWVCDYFNLNAEDFLKSQLIPTDAKESYVFFEPLGTILAIMPWNFPFWQFFRFAVPNLIAGNTIILKHSPNVSGCALAIEEIFRKAGFPEGIVKTILANVSDVSSILANSKIKGVSLTGSERAWAIGGKRSREESEKICSRIGGK